jgi:hypothetical protein
MHARFYQRRLKKVRKLLIIALPFFAFIASAWTGYQYFLDTDPINKLYILTIDGVDYSMHCTESTVGECLSKEGIVVMEKDYLFPSMTDHLVSGMQIIVRRAVPVTVINFVGEKFTINTRGLQVSDVINEIGVILKPTERVTPALNSWITPNMEIKLLAEREEIFERDVVIAFATEEKKDAALAYGKKVVEQGGENGKKTEQYRLVYSGDILKEKTLLKTLIKKEPITEIVRVGTKLPEQEESIEAGIASYYGSSFEGRRTASGQILHLDALVAAHKTLPFGTLVKVTNVKSGKSVIVRIVDRGPYVSGRVIDLSTGAFSQIASLSSGVASVRLAVLKE